MRYFAFCLIVGVSFSPLKCGHESPEAPQPVEEQTVAPQERRESQEQPSTGETPPEPLVAPIQLDSGAFVRHSGNITDADFRRFDFTSDDRAQFHAHGEQVCASGCAASRHPTVKLTKAKYLWLMRRFAEQPLDETSPALESLMYFGRQTLLWMEKLGTEPLDEPRVALLKRELRREHAYIAFQIVDEHGIVRVNMPRTRVPLDRRHEFRMETKDLPPLITSGTVKRVGLHHLWTRL